MPHIDASNLLLQAFWAAKGQFALALWLALPGGLGWWIWRGGLHARARYDHLRHRHATLAAGVARLLEARALLRFFSSAGDHEALEARSTALSERGAQIERTLRALEAELLRGWPWRVRRALGWAEQELQKLEAETHALSQSLGQLRDEDRRSETCLLEQRQQLAELRARCVPERVGWTRDLASALDACAQELDEAERQRHDGDTLRAFQRCRRNARALDEHRASLEAREITLSFLLDVPSRAARLGLGVARMQRVGYRALPEVDENAIAARATGAITALRDGRLEEAVAAQRALRDALAAIAEGSVAREERQVRNARRAKALRVDISTIARRCEALPLARWRADYPPRLWAPAQSLLDALAPRLDALRRALDAAETANGLEAQRFEAAEEQLAAIAREIEELRELAGQARTLWEALPHEETRLRERFLGLLGQCAETHARARQLGLMPDPLLEALVQTCRHTLAEQPLALDEAARALDGLEGALARFSARQRTLDERLATLPSRVAIRRSPHRTPR